MKAILNSFFVVVVTMVGAFFAIILILVGLRRYFDFYSVVWAKVINWLAHVELDVRGLKNIPAEPCLFVFNHSSLMDVSILMDAIPRSIRFGAKKELFYIPIFGWALHLSGMLKIDRADRMRAIKTLKKAAKIMDQGQSFVLAAEGTRLKEPIIGDFKSGPFVLAIEAKCKVVPVVIYGAREILNKNEIIMNLNQRNNVIVDILPAVSAVNYTFDQRHELKNQVRSAMVNSFENLKSVASHGKKS